jgi:hypothetical protein
VKNLCGSLNSIHDLPVPSATAEISRNCLTDLRLIRLRVAIEQRLGCDDEAGVQ